VQLKVEGGELRTIPPLEREKNKEDEKGDHVKNYRRHLQITMAGGGGRRGIST